MTRNYILPAGFLLIGFAIGFITGIPLDLGLPGHFKADISSVFIFSMLVAAALAGYVAAKAEPEDNQE